MDAFVILPDHLHCLWTLPEGDADYSSRWREIKKTATKELLLSEEIDTVWQRGFWEHVIRDDHDWQRHMDYIHFNPVKHGYVAAPSQWRWSSFNACVKKGWYDENWGTQHTPAIASMNWE
ncbi:transposase [Vreelandella malpeensis]|uniref:REP-associated tyrosine transposase n=1 Tax=Vreelandella malpeensis TaxID=1172368 RepID=UPI001D0BBC69